MYSIIKNFYYQDDEDDENDPKTKNIRQTEMIVDLRNTVHQICRHFSLCNEIHDYQINMQVRKKFVISNTFLIQKVL